ncbi:hypothetical protein BDV93DRAFT_354201 [Ceratobasidium sp. AG-I]|nr:hypothetical protein BDV93DRAFT_354201 [Ceratobasidium sp. AG-I]
MVDCGVLALARYQLERLGLLHDRFRIRDITHRSQQSNASSKFLSSIKARAERKNALTDLGSTSNTSLVQQSTSSHRPKIHFSHKLQDKKLPYSYLV